MTAPAADALRQWDGYRGSIAVPSDFDAFWEARMAEADAVPLEWFVVRAYDGCEGGCEYYDLWFAGMGGARLHAKWVRARADGPHPLVLQFHGYPGSSRSWLEQSSFAAYGCDVIALDNPGQGGLSEDVGGFSGTTVSGHLVTGIDGPPEGLYYVRLYQDVRILCRVVEEMASKGFFDRERIFANGASQGGAMAIAAAALNPALVAKAAVLYPFLSDMRLVWEIGADEIAYEGLRYYTRWFDPAGERLDEWFGKLAYYDTLSFAPRVACPVLFGTALDDTVVPPQAQCAVYNVLTCKKERLIYPGFGHEEVQAFDDLIPAFLGLDEPVRERISLGTGLPDALLMRPLEDAGPEGHPIALLFHDRTRPARGWHHMARFPANGFAVLQVENPADDSEALEAAVAALDAARSLAGIDASRILCTGEGFGATLALTAAAQGCWAAAAISPEVTEGLKGAASGIEGPVLLASCGMDESCPAAAVEELSAGIARAQHIHYPKHGHERVNAFEDALVRFIADL